MEIFVIYVDAVSCLAVTSPGGLDEIFARATHALLSCNSFYK